MGTKKELGAAIKEKLGALETSPDTAVWSSLRESLEKKKKRRIVPFWLYFGGIAVLILGFSMGIGMGNFMQSNEASENSTAPKVKQQEVSTEPESYSTTTKHTDGTQNGATQNDNNAVAVENTEQSSTYEQNSKDEIAKKEPLKQKAKRSNNAKNRTMASRAGILLIGAPRTNSGLQPSQNNLAINAVKRNTEVGSPTIQLNDMSVTKTDAATNIIVGDSASENILNAQELAVTETTETPILTRRDSLKEARKKNNLARQEELAKRNDSLEAAKRLVSITAFTGLGTGDLIQNQSSLDGRLDFLETNNMLTVHNGIRVNFNTGNRFTLRAGVSHYKMRSETAGINPNDVAISGLRFVGYSEDASSINAFTGTSTNVSLEQEFSYLEIPLSVRYDLLENHTLLGLVGGINYAMLLDNKVTLVNGSENLEIGRTTSLIKSSFSVHAGVGIRPRLARNFYLNVEPLVYFHTTRYNVRAIKPALDARLLVGLEYVF
jgi:cytoskeletal protein RodZ